MASIPLDSLKSLDQGFGADENSSRRGKTNEPASFGQPCWDYSASRTAAALQGGDDIASAYPISSIPFSASGTTEGYTDDYDEDCPSGSSGSPGPDVVYSYAPTVVETLVVDACDADFRGKVYVYRNSSSELVACNSGGCLYAIDQGSYIWWLEVTPSNTYYIVIDGVTTEGGAYSLHVDPYEPCEISCPGSGIGEGEPSGCDSPDLTNGGCAAGTPAFSSIQCGDVVCGTAGTFEEGDSAAVDQDWYELVLTEPKVVTWEAAGEFPLSYGLAITDPLTSMNCGDWVGYLYPRYRGRACQGKSWFTATLGPGTHWLVVQPEDTAGVPCDADYVLEVTCEDLPVDCPPGAIAEGEPSGCDDPDVTNGGCNSIPPVFSTISFGDTVCGTAGTWNTDEYINRDTDWWEFELTDSALVVWAVVADFRVFTGFVRTDPEGSGDCDDYVEITPWVVSEPGDTAYVSAPLGPGTHWLFVAPDWYYPTWCDAGYVAMLDSLSIDIGFDTSSGPSANVDALWCGDLDRDNAEDLVIMGYEPGSGLKIAWGDGQGSFSPVTTVNSSLYRSAVSVDFINVDTLLDILVVAPAPISESYVFLNNGDRSFSASVTSNAITLHPTTGLATGYFNDDPHLDYLTQASDYGDGILLGNGTGTFTSGGSIGLTFLASADIADMNGDGYDDIIAASYDSTYIFLNNQAGAFSRSLAFATGWTQSVSTGNALADFNRDGDMDFVTVTPWVAPGNATLINVGLGNGLGGLLRLDSMYIYDYADQIEVWDVDRDGELDIVANLPYAAPERLSLYFGDGAGNFSAPVPVIWGEQQATSYRAFASGDFDRDGNTDFAAGVEFGTEPIKVALSTLPDAPVLDDEMVTTGYNTVSVGVSNPQGFEISRPIRTVGGSAYWRLGVDSVSLLDEQAVDYNLQYGEYAISIRPRPDADPAGNFSAGIRIDGLSQYTLFNEYDVNKIVSAPLGRPAAGEDSIIFYFTVDSVQRFYPPNGLKIENNHPVFDWSGLVDGSAVSYRFQLDRYFDLEAPMYDITGLTSPEFQPPTSLGADSIFYWRFMSSDGSVYYDTSRTMAAFMGPGGAVCEGRTGNVDMSGEPPMEVDSSDLGKLVDYLFNPPGTVVLPCIDEADVDAQGGPNPVDSSDLGLLVSFLFADPPGSVVLPDCP